jgi:tetratricopeptide (TPR) repeat protein
LKNILLVVTTSLLSNAAATVNGGSMPLPIPTSSEDVMIVQAVLSEEAGDLNASRDMYEKLFTLTGNKEYLIQEAQDALSQKYDQGRSIANLTRWVTRHPTDHDKTLYLVLAALYLQTNALSDADEIVDAYLTQGEVDPRDLEEFGALKIQLGEYADALRLLQKAYEQSPTEENALQMAALYLLKLHQPEEAAEVLEKQIANDPETTMATYFKLIEIYAKAFKLKRVLNLYEKLYRKDPQKYFLQKIIEISLYRKDAAGLLHFLETTKGNDEILFGIYKDNELFDKALAVVDKLYARTRKPFWLAEKAMLVYEKAQKAHKVTPEVLRQMRQLFEDAFAKGVKKGIYLNYYGYTLIEHDLDVDKGIGLVRRALGRDPNNVFYLDSLAWGLYKKGQCHKAWTLMQRVIKQERLRDQTEIKDHLKAINACKQRK